MKWIRLWILNVFLTLLFAVYPILLTCLFMSHRNSDDNQWFWYPAMASMVYAIILVVGEVVEMKLIGFSNYTRRSFNLIDFVSIASSFCLYVFYRLRDEDLFIQFLGYVISLSWLELFLLLGRFPVFSKWVKMFLVVFKRSFLLALLFSLPLFGFTMGFQITFSDIINMSNVTSESVSDNTSESKNWKVKYDPVMVSKMFAMFAGELGHDSLNFKQYTGWRDFFFIAFVLLMVVCAANLLVGIAVNEIGILEREATINKYVELLQVINNSEKFFRNLSSFAPRMFSLEQMKSDIKVEIKCEPGKFYFDNDISKVRPCKLLLKSCCGIRSPELRFFEYYTAVMKKRIVKFRKGFKELIAQKDSTAETVKKELKHQEQLQNILQILELKYGKLQEILQNHQNSKSPSN